MSLSLKNVTFTYHPDTAFQTEVLTGIDLTLEPGEFVGLTGPAGSGKSTLLQTAAGLLTPQHGTVSADGRVGLVLQEPDHQLFEITLEREIAFAPKSQGLSESEISQRIENSLRTVRLDNAELRERSPFTLSGGEKRRAAIAGILAMDPRYLLLDEPLAGLDPEGTEILLAALKECCRKGTAILMAAHDPDVICEYADRMICMEQGRIVFDGSTEAAFAETSHPGIDRPELGSVRETIARLRAEIAQRFLLVEKNAFAFHVLSRARCKIEV